MSNKPIKLAVLLQDLEFGGTQRYAIHLLRYLNRDLFSPELWLMRRGTDMLPLAEETGVKIVWLSQSARVGAVSLFCLLTTIRRFRPDILYTLTVVPNIWGRLFGRVSGVPVIVSGFRNVVAEPLERWLWRFSTRIICNAEAGREFLVQQFSVNSERLAVVPNAVDTSYFCPDEHYREPNPMIVSIGRLVEQKDPLTLLEAFRQMGHDLPAARLVLVGNGHLRETLQHYVGDHSLGSRVEILPGTSDTRSLLRRAWVFAMSSLYEGSPNVILEAMSTGLPVVSTSVGGISELVRDGETGFLIEPGNSADLAKALTNLLNDRERCRSMGNRARECMLHGHSAETMVRRTEQVLLDAAAEALERRK